MRFARRLVILLSLAIIPLGLTCRGADQPCDGAAAGCTRVLFVGNSYTSVNNLPSMFAKLAASGGHRVDAAMTGQGGWTLAEQASSGDLASRLSSSEWDVVVLQEQSQIPASDTARRATMFPAARQLVADVRAAGAQPMLFLTWAHRDGWPEQSLPDYASMQSAIDDGYLAIGREQGVAIAPVGRAWSIVIGEQAQPGLWQDDGSHPTVRGTYLAACVFYAAIFGENPSGLRYRAGLSEEEATRLQYAAADAVLVDPAAWNIDLTARAR